MTQVRSLVEKPRAVWMWGRAMFTMVASSTTISWQAAMTVRAMPGRGGRSLRPGRASVGRAVPIGLGVTGSP